MVVEKVREGFMASAKRAGKVAPALVATGTLLVLTSVGAHAVDPTPPADPDFGLVLYTVWAKIGAAMAVMLVPAAGLLALNMSVDKGMKWSKKLGR